MRKPGLVALATLALAAPVGADAATPTAAGPQGLDARFGSCGVLKPPVTARFGAGASELAREPDGSIVAAGVAMSGDVTPDTFVIARFSAAGAIDTGFGSGGAVKTPIDSGKGGGEVRLTGLAIQPDGKIVVSGHALLAAPEFHFEAVLARYNTDGSLDPSFGKGGIVMDALPAKRGGKIEDVAIAPNGGIVAAGMRNDATMKDDPLNEQDRFTVARYRSDGSLDPAFGTGGLTSVDSGFGPSTAGALDILPDGRIVAVGGAAREFALARLTAAGALDPTFGEGGASYASPPAAASATAVATMSDGRIVVTGAGTNVNGDQTVVGRYTSAGRPDSTFGRDGFVIDPYNGSPSGLALAADGAPTLAVNGGLLRLGADGSRVSGFGADGLLTGFTNFGIKTGDLLVQPDGTTLVAEEFGRASLNSSEAFAIVRLATDEPALGATASEPQICSARIANRKIRNLLTRGLPPIGGRFGTLTVALTVRMPGSLRLRAVVKVGTRTITIGRTVSDDDTFGAREPAIFVPKRVNRLLRKASQADVTVTIDAADGSGESKTITRHLTR